MTRRPAPSARPTGPTTEADGRASTTPTVRISSSTVDAPRAPTTGATRPPAAPGRSRGKRPATGRGPATGSGPATGRGPTTGPGPATGGEAEASTASRHGHRPSRLVLLVAATVTVVVVALFVVPRVREQQATGPADRTVDTYTVTLGDTISSVAQLHGTTRDAVEEANGLTAASSIEPGSQIEIPHPVGEDSELPTFLAADPALVALRPTFAAKAAAYDVPPALLESLAWQVSAWDEDKVGEDGRVGIAQLRPSTVDFINEELVAGPDLDPEVAAESIELMAAYVDELLTETDGSWAATAAAYSLGLNASRTSNWDGDTIGFVTTVLAGVPDFEGG